MRTQISPRILATGLSFVTLFLALSVPLPAALVMEADYSVGKDLTVGTPATGTLTGGAVVSGGALQVTSSGSSGVTYGTVNNYLNVSGTSWGSNTLVATYSLNANGNTRQTLFSTSGDNASGIILWGNVDNATRGIRLDIYNANTGVSPTTWLSNSKPLANTDYFVSASWQDNENGTLAVELYFRELNDLIGTTAIYQAFSVSNPSGTNGMTNSTTQTVNLGHRINSDALNGDIYLFQTYNTFTSSQAGFDALFNSVVVPEPGTTVLLSVGALALLGFRRFRRKDS
ncbi:MAG TPA: PEP-CTERM sorting domain-containing protein [Terrimicrobiaceae bacterium]|nr:PEP-CTERM sorting domain-containing protein [Terrimicrobiaceae bacterium]